MSRTWEKKRLFSHKNEDSLSCEQAGIKAGSLSTHTQIQRTVGLLLQQAGHPARIPKRLSQESSIPGSAVSRTAVPPLCPRSRGPGRSWKGEELGFSQGLGWPIAPPAKPHCPQRGCRALPKASTRDAPVPQEATPSPNPAKYSREISALRDAFFLRTPDPQCNWKSDILRHRPAPFSPSCLYEASKKAGRALDNFWQPDAICRDT